MTWADDVAQTLKDNGVLMKSVDTSVSWGVYEPPTMPIELWSLNVEPLHELFHALLSMRSTS